MKDFKLEPENEEDVNNNIMSVIADIGNMVVAPPKEDKNCE